MNLKQAEQLHNRDEVQVRTPEGQWEQGYVLGEPRRITGIGYDTIIIPVQTPQNGFREVDHTEIR